MKIPFQIVVLVIILTTMITACRKQKDYPPDTNEGKNVFGCYVDGQLFVPCNSFQWSVKSIIQNGDLSRTPFAYVAAQNRCNKNSDYGSEITLYIDSIKLEENKTYKLGSTFNRGNGQIGLRYRNESTYYSSDSTLNGTITIRKVDASRKILSANFQGTVRTADGSQNKELTKGTFDITFW